MTIDTKDMLNSILSSISRIDYVRPDDIPNIDLYMDQVTTFMEKELASSKRHEDDKILTKTMINNYAKNNLLPPPVKKKYSKDRTKWTQTGLDWESIHGAGIDFAFVRVASRDTKDGSIYRAN